MNKRKRKPLSSSSIVARNISSRLSYPGASNLSPARKADKLKAAARYRESHREKIRAAARAYSKKVADSRKIYHRKYFMTAYAKIVVDACARKCACSIARKLMADSNLTLAEALEELR